MLARTFKVLARIDRKAAFLLPLLLVLAPAPAQAHKVNVFAYVEGDKVIAEGYFADGGKCRDAVVEIYNNEGKKLLEGRTDSEGRFAFKPTAHTDLLVRLIASMGHQAEYTLPATDLLPNGVSSELRGDQEQESASGQAALSQTAPADIAALERAIDRAVARQVAPLRRALEEERNRRSLLDIVGGIGYIAGLMGVILYYRAKKVAKND